MTGWLLIFILLILGGVLSTLGDRLGSRLGKARLTIFNLRPRRTAIVITVITGSLISALSLGLMLLVSRQLRVGLFELNELQAKLITSRSALETSRVAQRTAEKELLPLQRQRKLLLKRIKAGGEELKLLQSNLIALRSGEVVLSSGQPLATATIKLDEPGQAKSAINKLLQEANLEAFTRVNPGEKPNRQILLVPRSDIERLEKIISQDGVWVVNFRSATNVLLGEKLVYAYPEVRPNITIALKGEILARTLLEVNERSSEAIRKRLKLLLASTFAEVKRRGSLSRGLQFDPKSMNELGAAMLERPIGKVPLEAISITNSGTADTVVVLLRVSKEFNNPDLPDSKQ